MTNERRATTACTDPRYIQALSARLHSTFGYNRSDVDISVDAGSIAHPPSGHAWPDRLRLWLKNTNSHARAALSSGIGPQHMPTGIPRVILTASGTMDGMLPLRHALDEPTWMTWCTTRKQSCSWRISRRPGCTAAEWPCAQYFLHSKAMILQQDALCGLNVPLHPY